VKFGIRYVLAPFWFFFHFAVVGEASSVYNR